VGTSTSHKPMGLHGPLQGYLYCFTRRCIIYSKDHALALILSQINFIHTFPYYFLRSNLLPPFHPLLNIASHYFSHKCSACFVFSPMSGIGHPSNRPLCGGGGGACNSAAVLTTSLSRSVDRWVSGRRNRSELCLKHENIRSKQEITIKRM
jgi:hypothetical protein